MGQLFSSLMQYLFPNREYKIVMVRAYRDPEAILPYREGLTRF